MKLDEYELEERIRAEESSNLMLEAFRTGVGPKGLVWRSPLNPNTNAFWAEQRVIKEREDAERAQSAPLPAPGAYFDYKIMRRQVCDAMGISVKQFLGICRKRIFVQTRAIVAMILLERGWSKRRIAPVLGRTDHSTVFNLVQQWPAYCKMNPRVPMVFRTYRRPIIRIDAPENEG